MNVKKIRVCAIQMTSINGETERNLATAENLINQAAAHAPQLILLPELFAIGYDLSENIWNSAERQGGRTEQWLQAMAKKLRCHIGGSYLQVDGDDFVNIFSLATPEGEIAGRVPKRIPGYIEPYIYAGKETNHLIETSLGRLGVAVCYDSCFRSTTEAFIKNDVDMILIPLSGPTPQKRWYYSDAKMEEYNNTYRQAASKFSQLLGVPAILANKRGPWKTKMRGIIPDEDSWFYGQSEISDSDGRSLKELDDAEAFIVADVTLNPARKTHTIPTSSDQYGKWNGPVPSEFKMLRLFEWMGKRSYTKNKRRIKAAHCIAQTQELSQ